MASKYFHLIEVTPEAKAYVDCSFQIADQIRQVLREQGKTQRDLAALLGKKEAEISRMMSGTHNFTIKTLTRLQVALGVPLITTPQRVQEQAVALTLHGTMPSEETLTADWQPVQLFAKPGGKTGRRSSEATAKKAADNSAAFSIAEEEAMSYC
jgi:transcriptional regulator with XRE-family HTH domain